MDIRLNNPAETAAFYLGLAINHFVSTADHVGIASIMAEGNDQPFVIIPVNKTSAVDQENVRRLRDRLLWMKPLLLRNGIQVSLDDKPVTTSGDFETYRLTVPVKVNDMLLLAGAVAAAGEPTGWGTCKRDVDRLLALNPKLREQFQAFRKDVAPHLTFAGPRN